MTKNYRGVDQKFCSDIFQKSGTWLYMHCSEEIKITFSDENSVSSIISRDEIKNLITNSLHTDGEYLNSSFEGFEKEMAKLFEEKDDPPRLRSETVLEKKKKNL